MNSLISCLKARRRSGSNSGKMVGSGVWVSSAPSCSHWKPKLVTSDSARGSASIRRTSASSTLGWLSLLSSASFSSGSSGTLLQRKKDRREARSRSLMAKAAPGARPLGWVVVR